MFVQRYNIDDHIKEIIENRQKQLNENQKKFRIKMINLNVKELRNKKSSIFIDPMRNIPYVIIEMFAKKVHNCFIEI